MTKILFLLTLLLASHGVISQHGDLSDVSLNQCEGAVNIFDDGDFKLQFTGKKGGGNAVDAYPSLSEINSDNIIWLSFIAPVSGELTFKATVEEGFLQMVVFEEEFNDICGEIDDGMAEIKRLHVLKDQTAVGLDYQIGGGVLYSLKIKEGRKVQLLFATDSESQKMLTLNWKFNPGSKLVTEPQIVDKRYDEFSPTFRILLKDRETNQSLVGNLSIEGNRELAGLYVGSEFLFNIEYNCQLDIKCDVEGYFFEDHTEDVSAFVEHELILLLERVSSGKSIKIEEIEFVPGTSEITKSSEPKLGRLKDFLALNSDINVEIQGHVFAKGENSTAGQRISEARAKRVMEYLVDNGIDRKRLTAIGYGNTRPIYADPKFYYEEQANRRVEIVVE